MRHWMRTPVAPVLWPEGAESCPRCRRPLPGALAPGAAAAGAVGPIRWPMRTSAELTQLRPVDGLLGRKYAPREMTVAALRERATDLADDLRSARDPGWAKYFERASATADDDGFLRAMGDALAVLVHRGPVRDLRQLRTEVEQLLVDTVALWRPTPMER